jgi:hypothetical protein
MAGYHHDCVLLEDGTARCWGVDEYGQLGVGSTVAGRSATPAVVHDLEGAIALAGGRDHTCAVVEGGTVRCWGSNAKGQLGDGTTTDSARPVSVLGLEGAVDVVAGENHTCALLRDGTVRCWGDTEDSYLGDSGTPGGDAVPVPVEGITGAVGLVAGPNATCALLGAAGVSCWGSLYWGSGSDDVAFGAEPTIIPGTAGARDAALGEAHACFLLDDGSVACLGRNSEGQLGDGGNDHSRTLVTVRGLRRVAALAAGWYHTCALLDDGSVRCWGENDEGMLGDGSLEARSVPVAVRHLYQVVALAADDDHTCALRADDSIACWGYMVDLAHRSCRGDHCTQAVDIRLDQAVLPSSPPGAPEASTPARFTFEVVTQDSSLGDWTEGDGYREATGLATLAVTSDDPRVEGTLTLAVTMRRFGADEAGDYDFEIAVGAARIDNDRGTWVGTLHGLGSGDFSDAQLLLEGERAYEGLTALMRLDEYDGVIFAHGLPPIPSPLEPPTGQLPTPTTPGA